MLANPFPESRNVLRSLSTWFNFGRGLSFGHAVMKCSPFREHEWRNLQPYALNQFTRFRVENRATRRPSHEHDKGRFPARFCEFRRGSNCIKIECAGAAGDKQEAGRTTCLPRHNVGSRRGVYDRKRRTRAS
jgi:hypothetical protein